MFVRAEVRRRPAESRLRTVPKLRRAKKKTDHPAGKVSGSPVVSPLEVFAGAECVQSPHRNGCKGIGCTRLVSLQVRQKRSIDTTALLLLCEAGEMTCSFYARLQFVAKFKGKIYEFKSFVSCNVPEITSIGGYAQWGINGENIVIGAREFPGLRATSHVRSDLGL